MSILMMKKVSETTRRDVLKVKFDLIGYDAVMETIGRWRRNDERHYVTLVNPHSVMQCHRDREMFDAIELADMTLPDGVGIILAANLLGYGHEGRVTGPALMLEMCDWGRKYGYRHYFYGGENGVSEKLVQALARRYPGLEIAGTCFSSTKSLYAQDEEKIIEMINSSDPDIVWVGLGSPEQEKWMARHLGKVKAPAMIGVGAAFAFHSGTARWAPGWNQETWPGVGISLSPRAQTDVA